MKAMRQVALFGFMLALLDLFGQMAAFTVLVTLPDVMQSDSPPACCSLEPAWSFWAPGPG